MHSKLIDLEESGAEQDLSHKPKTPFSALELKEKWATFGKLLKSEGELNMASIINANQPVLKDGFKIVYALPNKLMEDQFGAIRAKLLNYLRKELNNYAITVLTEVFFDEEKKYVYTPQEKLQKLIESNPDVLLLKNKFGLDI
ncbi:MAG: hypothetical protein ACN4EF_04600 [Wenyingzhuangia sp.]|jgi:hypothetical protein